MESCQGLRTGTGTIRWQQQWYWGGHREGVFTDLGWGLITAGAGLGDKENWEQETLPHPALCGQSPPAGAPTSWDSQD